MGEWKSSNDWKDVSPVDLNDQILQKKLAHRRSDRPESWAYDAAERRLECLEQQWPKQRQALAGSLLSCPDTAFRWQEGERLDHLYERRCDRFGTLLAVVTASGQVTYQELDCRANQTARYLA